ncbi:S-adenosyl-L-methionine-dependent methyltransferase [Bisporella sp. PMI_857]|nr:S-adenosyl-L-methionine-dependent methyltransferase [Bisporella sp. PMI_857]
MPRLQHKSLLRAYNITPLLPLVLRGTRDIPSAIRELRWIVEHVQKICPATKPSKVIEQKKLLLKLCRRRESSEPLQYILGSQPFGDLDIKCRRGVLIPRPETESYTTYAAKLLLNNQLHPGITKKMEGYRKGSEKDKLRIYDFCSGSGCISLLLFSMLSKQSILRNRLDITGFDISKEALSIARDNLRTNFQIHNIPDAGNNHPVRFEHLDLLGLRQDDTTVLKEGQAGPLMDCSEKDIIICNPPYVARDDWRVGRSVRNWEPSSAVFPPSVAHYVEDERMVFDRVVNRPGARVRLQNCIKPWDIFYWQLMSLCHKLFRCKVLIMEVSDKYQARRVRKMALDLSREPELRGMILNVSFWRDYQPEPQIKDQNNTDWRGIKGTGKVRCVVVRFFSKTQLNAIERSKPDLSYPKEDCIT